MASEMKIYPVFSLNCSYFSATHFRISICHYSLNTRMYRTTCTQGPHVPQHAVHTTARTNTHLSAVQTDATLARLHSASADLPPPPFFFCSSGTSVLWLWYFWYLLPIIHFITSPPFLSAVFYHSYYHFLEGGLREGKKNSSRVRGSAANTTNQHYLVCMGRPRLSCYKLACGSRPTVHCISQMPSM